MVDDSLGLRSSDSFDVVQVGYGPVGQVMAGLLGRYGHRIVVFERHRELYQLPRAAGLDHETMRVLQSLGVADDFEAHACPLDGFDMLDARLAPLLRADFSQEGEHGWAPRYLFYQPDLERALDRAVRALPNVWVQQGWQAIGLKDGVEHAELTVEQPATGQTRTIRARYVVAADGANSFVRTAAGIDWVDLGHRAPFLALDYRPADPEADIADLPDIATVFDPAQPRFMMRRVGWKHARWEFLLPADADFEAELEEARCWQRLAPWVTPADGRLIRRTVYSFHARLAQPWRRGRVLLVGDAAHVMPPTLGQGLNSGVRDAANLAWKLNLVLSQHAEDTLLDSYQRERAPHVRGLTTTAAELAEAWFIRDPAAAAARDAAMRAAAGQPPPPFPGLTDGVLYRDGHHRPVPPAGQRFVQGLVEYHGTTGRFDDVVGNGFTIIALDADPGAVVDTRQQAFLKQIDAQLVHLSGAYQPGANIVADLRGTYTRWYRQHNLRVAVVRPDHYLFGAAADLDDLPHLLDSLAEQLQLRACDSSDDIAAAPFISAHTVPDHAGKESHHD